MTFFELIEKNNQDCKFTDSIIESEFVEKIKESYKKYNNFLFCILDNYEPLLANILNEEKKIVFHKCIMNIGSKIEEEPEKYYHNFGYDEKIMKINTIQIGLQCSSKKEIILSTLVYLNDLYKTHFIFVDSHKNRFYQTCCKNYPIHYLIWNQKFCTLEKTISPLILEDNIDNSIITKDLKNTNPYKSYLKAISKYKIDELKKIATDLNISLKADGKNKVKQVLYNEINTYQLNKI